MAAKTTAPRAKRGAVRRSVAFHGIKVAVPEVLPGDLAFEFANPEATPVSLLKIMVGDAEVAKIRGALQGKGLDLAATTTELLDLIGKIADASNTTTGK